MQCLFSLLFNGKKKKIMCLSIMLIMSKSKKQLLPDIGALRLYDYGRMRGFVLMS